MWKYGKQLLSILVTLESLLALFGTLQEWRIAVALPIWFHLITLAVGISALTYDWWWPHVASKNALRLWSRKVYTYHTVGEICEEYHNLSLRHKYSLQGEFKSPEIGKWLTIVNEEIKWEPIVGTDSIVVHIQDRSYEVEMHFSRKFLKRLAGRTHGDRILAEGKIAEVGGFGLKLRDCTLV